MNRTGSHPKRNQGLDLEGRNCHGGASSRSYRTLSMSQAVPGWDRGRVLVTSDQELVSRYLEGDSEAVGIVHSWISRAAWPYQRRLSNRWEDVLQDVRLEVTRLLGQGRFRGESSLRTYLWQVVSHTCLDQLRAQGRWQWTELGELDEAGSASPPLLATAGSGHEEWDLARRVLRRVSEECRVLWRLILMGHSYREMSQRLGVAEGTLRVRALRCREKAVAVRNELLGGLRGRERNAGAGPSA
jgi:RNA polymerase sigma factor (sigma-70 family)